ncbi:unnamed protein product [Closterium sp. NIES-53]
MAGPEERGGRGAGGSGEAQAQGQPCNPTMSPMQPSFGPPRDEPRVFGLDKFNGDNFAEWSFKMGPGILGEPEKFVTSSHSSVNQRRDQRHGLRSSTGAGGAGTGGASSDGAGAGVSGSGGAHSKATGAGGTTTREEMWQLDQQEQQQRQLQPQKPPLLQQLFPPVSGLRALGLPSAPPVRSQSPTAYGPTFPSPDSALARARPSSPFDNLSTVLFRSSRHRAPPVCVLPPPRASSLTVSTHPITDYYRAARPVVSRVLASLVTDPHASRSSFSALIAAVADLSSTRRLDIATRVVAALPARPLSSRGEFALCYDVL